MVEIILILLAIVLSFIIGFDTGRLAGLCEAEKIVFDNLIDGKKFGDKE